MYKFALQSGMDNGCQILLIQFSIGKVWKSIEQKDFGRELKWSKTTGKESTEILF